MEDDDLKQYSTWYVALIAAGAVIASASAAVRNDSAFLVGLGFVMVGVGEFMNHPFRTALRFDDFGRPIYKVFGRARAPKVVGVAIDVLGVGLGAVGLFRILFS
jgi:hypothetical protein